MKIKREDTIKQLCTLFESIKDLPFIYSIGSDKFPNYEGEIMFDKFPEYCKYVSFRHIIYYDNRHLRYRCIINTENRTFYIMCQNTILKHRTTLHRLNENVIRETYEMFLKCKERNVFKI
jgi:hypothetical protein